MALRTPMFFTIGFFAVICAVVAGGNGPQFERPMTGMAFAFIVILSGLGILAGDK